MIRSRNQNFTIGDGKPFDGRRARTETQLSALQKYSSVLLDYCHYGDPMCAVGSEPPNVYVHLDYFFQHNEEVIKYLSSVAKAATGQVSSPPSRPSSGSSAVPSVVAKPASTGSQTMVQPSSSSTMTNTPEASSSSSASANAQKGGAASLELYHHAFALVAGMMLVSVVI